VSNPSQDQPTSTNRGIPIVPGQPPVSGHTSVPGKPPNAAQPTVPGQPPIAGQPAASGQPPVPVVPPAQPGYVPLGGPAPKRRLGTGGIIAIVAGVLVIACCGVGLLSLLVSQRPSENAKAPQASSSSTTTRAPRETTTTPVAPTTQPPRVVPEDQVFEGVGADVVALDLDPEFAHIATITHHGSRNFIVWTVDANGSRMDLVVNEIGTYSGVRPIDFRESPAALQIEADGAWTIVVQALEKAPRWPAQSSGTGSAVLVVDPSAVRGLTTVAITHSGESNFVVWAYGERNADLLVNEIGSYSGRTILPTWAIALEIEADGAWTITAS